MIQQKLAARWLLIAMLSFWAVAAQATTFRYSAFLSGPNEAPPNNSPATGVANIDYDDVTHALFFDVTFFDLLGTSTASHIHSATASVGIGTARIATVVPSLPNFPSGVQSGSYQFMLDLTLPQSFNLLFLNVDGGGSAAGAELALAGGLAGGLAYFDIASTEFPGGEIRGFLFPRNNAPVVSAGQGQTVCDDIQVVSLQGSASDPDGDALTHHWTQVAGPAVALTGADTASATFTPPFVSPVQGSVTLTFQLEATDDGTVPLSSSATVNVLVKHSNRPPLADAGADITAPEGTTVSLNGAGSFDPDNDPIAAYAWTQISGPIVTLNSADTATPNFIAPDVGVGGAALVFELVVTDAPGDEFCGAPLSSVPQTVRVNVQYLNRPPSLAVVTPIVASEGTTVVLHAAANDPDGNPLTFTWTQLSGPVVTLDLLDPAHPTFIAPQVSCAGASLAFTVVVADEYGGSAQADVAVNVNNVNNPPVADAGPNQTVPEGSAVSLNALASSDADGEPLTYNWIQMSGPTVSLGNSSTARPAFVAPIVTSGGDPNASELLVFQVTVMDACSGVATDLVDVKVTNVDHSPVANAGGSQTVSEGAAVTLNGSLSSDPDGDGLSYSWTQISGPPVILASANSAIATFAAPMVGVGGDTLVFKLTVSDGFGGTASDTATIAVLNVNAPPDCSAAKASLATLWPPNHSMIAVTILGLQDPEGNATITITGVTQDEPTNSTGDGDTGPDAIIEGSSVLLRAERSGKGNGRVYHVHFTASDFEGYCSGVVAVTVPHDKASATAVDGGELFDSTR